MKINENLWNPDEKQYKSHSFTWILLDFSSVFPSFVCFSMLYGQPSGWPYTMEIHTKLGITEEKSSKIHAKLCNLYCFSSGFRRFSLIIIAFQRFSLLFTTFGGCRIRLHWFTWFFFDFHRFSIIFIAFHQVVEISIYFPRVQNYCKTMETIEKKNQWKHTSGLPPWASG